MQKYNKIQWQISDDAVAPEPLLEIIECQRCGYRQPVPVEFIDWEEIAGRYEKAYNGMADCYWRAIEEAGQVFDVPLKEWFEARKQHFFLELEHIMEELKKRDNDNIG